MRKREQVGCDEFYSMRSPELAKFLAAEFRAEDEREHAKALELADLALHGKLPPRPLKPAPPPPVIREPESEIPIWCRAVFEGVCLQWFEAEYPCCGRALTWLVAHGFITLNGGRQHSRRSATTRHPLGRPAQLTAKGRHESKVLGYDVQVFAEAYNSRKYAKSPASRARSATT